ncbi:hypothetical protein [Oharaeibacter diazotrophicus]|uniref:Uncharacterized protein n=1 Tax=Oharaeibacter diazotrophicus TaxID=1920512 RepID=A0A4R6RBM4_9HYPH|nr:hypothetical protein [Oharaeibacter diazotrophicus]TDP83543.1 hypothetical protein EDD54_3505 [Oharaeibacter diazotrophicus]BBE72376.1 hypothetical protein OHA_1_01966 [Pleomorphomonas sp. SM30]GLS79147.1 hypothetical protein GCM10007904_44840 [Oharaeibacter diazotrophicus]
MKSFAALAAAALVASATAATAAPTIAGAYWSERVLKVCDNTSFCELNFTAVPAGKTLIATDAGCVVTMPTNQAISAISVSGRKADNTSIGLTNYVQISSFSSDASSRRYQGQTKMTHLVLATQRATVTASKSAAVGEFIVSCTLTGTLQ